MKPVWRRCGSDRTSAESSTAPQGMPAPARISSTSCFGRVSVHASIMASISSTNCTRSRRSCVARIVAQLGPADDPGQRLPHLHGGAVDEDVVVRPAGTAAVDVRRRRRRRAVALARGRLAGGVGLAQVDAEQVHHGVLLGDLDLLAHAGGLALDDGGQDADGGVQSRAGVGEAADGLGRRAVGRARHAHGARPWPGRSTRSSCSPRTARRRRSPSPRRAMRRGFSCWRRLVAEAQAVHHARRPCSRRRTSADLHQLLEHGACRAATSG